ncbi:RrF2 family transcriptional regulator [Azospirillum doebereinerae]
MLSQKAKYALRALIMLAERVDDEELILIADIAEQENIPRKFLEAILVELRKQGLLFAKRGKSGGYRLARPPSAITFGEVIRLIDGHLAPLPCASKFSFKPCDDCLDPGTCSVRWLMVQVRDATAGVLDHHTLADALRHRQSTGDLAPNFDI